MHVILGAGGAISSGLVKELRYLRQRVKLVGRNPHRVEGANEVQSADLADLHQAVRAIEGAKVVHLVVGLKYDLKVWRDLWPRIMNNTIEACKRANAKLIFFDNLYMYGKVAGPMTETSPFNPCTKKGEVRAQIATALLDEIKAGNLSAMIARSADFYGPGAKASVANMLVFDKFADGATASWLVDDTVPHSFTYTPDAAKCLAILANSDSAWNQTWHVPTAANPPTGREFIHMAAQEFGVQPNYRILSRRLIKFAGWFDSNIRESYEMLYQNDTAYLFDSTKFENAFGFKPTTYVEGIAGVAQTCKRHAGPAHEGRYEHP
jgi:nucleoside-diphosphate-sugar epimerase